MDNAAGAAAGATAASAAALIACRSIPCFLILCRFRSKGWVAEKLHLSHGYRIPRCLPRLCTLRPPEGKVVVVL